MPTPCHTTITNLDDGHMYSNKAKQARSFAEKFGQCYINKIKLNFNNWYAVTTHAIWPDTSTCKLI